MLSVIVPSWRRYWMLEARCLPSILADPGALEVIVVFDGPDPSGVAAVARVAAVDGRVRSLEIERPLYPAGKLDRWRSIGTSAVNAGLDAAAGDWLLIVDDDDEVAPGGIRILAQAAARSSAGVVWGSTKITWPDRGVTVTRAEDGPPAFRLFPRGAAMLRRSALAGRRFNPDAYQDDEPADEAFWRGLVAAGVTFERIDGVVYHYFPTASAPAWSGPARSTGANAPVPAH